MSSTGNQFCECGNPATVKTIGTRICQRCANIERRNGRRFAKRNPPRTKAYRYAPMAEDVEMSKFPSRAEVTVGVEKFCKRHGMSIGYDLPVRWGNRI